jgi:prevent-host-death family protein
MAKFSVQQAQTHLPDLIERAFNGDEIVITQAGKPIARLVPILKEQVASRVPGVDKGKIIIRPNFDDPLDEFDT